MEVYQKAYLAGLIDGEGSISIHRCSHKRGCPASKLQLVLSITSTSKKLLDYCKVITGDGEITLKRKATLKHRACYEWRARNHHAGRILFFVFPYLVLKKNQAKLGIEFAGTIRPRGGSTPLSMEIQNFREQIRIEMMKLNQRRGGRGNRSWLPETKQEQLKWINYGNDSKRNFQAIWLINSL